MTSDCFITPWLILKGSDIDFAAVTAILGVQPTVTWRLGDRVGNSLVRRKYDAWVLSIPGIDTFEIEDAIKGLLNHLGDAVEQVRSACSELGLSATVFCGVDFVENRTPAVVLENELLQIIVSMGAAVEVDLIMLPPRTSGE
jgi:hypothetical protein